MQQLNPCQPKNQTKRKKNHKHKVTNSNNRYFNNIYHHKNTIPSTLPHSRYNTADSHLSNIIFLCNSFSWNTFFLKPELEKPAGIEPRSGGFRNKLSTNCTSNNNNDNISAHDIIVVLCPVGTRKNCSTRKLAREARNWKGVPTATAPQNQVKGKTCTALSIKAVSWSWVARLFDHQEGNKPLRLSQCFIRKTNNQLKPWTRMQSPPRSLSRIQFSVHCSPRIHLHCLAVQTQKWLEVSYHHSHRGHHSVRRVHSW